VDGGGEQLFVSGPKLRRYAPLQPSHRRYVPSLPPDDPAQPHAVQPTASQFLLIFSPEFLRFGPLIASNSSPTQPSTSYCTPQKHRKVQAESQAQGDVHRPERILYETRREEVVVERWAPGSLTPSSSPLTPPLGPSDDEDTDPPHAVIVHVPPGARKSKFSTFPDKRGHLLLVRLVDQTLPLPADHCMTTPRRPPTLRHWILATSPKTTHPGTQCDQPATSNVHPYRLWMGQRPRLPHSRIGQGIPRLGIHSFRPTVSPPPDEIGPTSLPSRGASSAWSIISGASTQRSTSLTPPRPQNILILFARPPSKMYRKMRDARYVNPSILRNILQLQLYSVESEVEPSSRRLFSSKPLRLFSSSEG